MGIRLNITHGMGMRLTGVGSKTVLSQLLLNSSPFPESIEQLYA